MANKQKTDANKSRKPKSPVPDLYNPHWYLKPYNLTSVQNLFKLRQEIGNGAITPVHKLKAAEEFIEIGIQFALNSRPKQKKEEDSEEKIDDIMTSEQTDFCIKTVYDPLELMDYNMVADSHHKLLTENRKLKKDLEKLKSDRKSEQSEHSESQGRLCVSILAYLDLAKAVVTKNTESIDNSFEIFDKFITSTPCSRKQLKDALTSASSLTDNDLCNDEEFACFLSNRVCNDLRECWRLERSKTETNVEDTKFVDESCVIVFETIPDDKSSDATVNESNGDHKINQTVVRCDIVPNVLENYSELEFRVYYIWTRALIKRVVLRRREIEKRLDRIEALKDIRDNRQSKEPKFGPDEKLAQILFRTLVKKLIEESTEFNHNVIEYVNHMKNGVLRRLASMLAINRKLLDIYVKEYKLLESDIRDRYWSKQELCPENSERFKTFSAKHERYRNAMRGVNHDKPKNGKRPRGRPRIKRQRVQEHCDDSDEESDRLSTTNADKRDKELENGNDHELDKFFEDYYLKMGVIKVEKKCKKEKRGSKREE